jgi:hypothetical protein
MSSGNEFHSVQNAAGVHHTSRRCAIGRQVQYYWIRHGTGGLPQCPICTELEVVQTGGQLGHAELIADLHRLIVALDSRLPRSLHADETGIAREAEVLRERALARIAELEGPPA